MDCRRLVLHETPRISGRPVCAVETSIQHAKHCSLLPAVMGGMGDASDDDPGSAPVYVKERDFLLPPRIVLGT